ncbi:unnamed protein product [Ranitomeya imitator]|uniref:JMY/WHAMM middle domain-containing protein n=1 Tax=Ranitomeya imitator TaxID=111125 RepID=A0ABN9LZ31_9NEOB|nr:unnamed protein product [Ranitomeya imitator]
MMTCFFSTAMQKHMELDRRRFGQATWASAVPRLERIKSMLAKESLQHMRSKELCLNQKRADIKLSMENLINCEGAIACLDRLELQYYETQLELYDVQFDILKHEEMLLITELDTLRRQMKEHLPAFSCTFIGTYGVRVQIMAMNGSATVSYECCAYQSNLLPLGGLSRAFCNAVDKPRCNLKDKKNKLDYTRPGAVPLWCGPMGVEVRVRRLPSSYNDVLFFASCRGFDAASPQQQRRRQQKGHQDTSKERQRSQHSKESSTASGKKPEAENPQPVFMGPGGGPEGEFPLLQTLGTITDTFRYLCPIDFVLVSDIGIGDIRYFSDIGRYHPIPILSNIGRYRSTLVDTL